MADTEEYFPRGGKKPTAIFKQSANFLGAPEKGDKKKKKPKKKSEGDDGYLSDEADREIDQSSKNCAVGLSYKTVKEGVTILGRVRYVYETKMTVMLPCKLLGSVMACHISDAYNKILEAYVNDKTDTVCELTKMFHPGQYIAVKVLEVKEKTLMLSVMPQHVNEGKPLSDVVKGSLFQAAVSSVEDHGYVMDIGIPNTRTFLPKKDVNPELELDVGMVAWCAVKSVSGSVVAVSAAPGAVQGALLKSKPAGALTPGSCVEFIVDTPLENGIEGVIFGDTTCYVQRQHVDKVKGKKPTLGQKIRGRVLYVLPTRKTPFLTMKNIFESAYPDLKTEQTLRDGDVVEQAQVLKIIGRSVHFKLGRGNLGVLSLRRVQVDEDLADEEVVAKSYPVGSKHKVRVLCYNLSDYVYSVTDRPEVVHEPYFSMDRLEVGQVVAATVGALHDTHAVLNVGRFKGFVPHTHLTEGGVFVDPKKGRKSNLAHKKYKVGQQVSARVWSVEPGRQHLVLSMKPSLLAPDLEVLKSFEEAQIGKVYTGVIRYISEEYLLVSFFNDVVAYVPRLFVSQQRELRFREAFHLGQTVNCTILSKKVEDKRMSGSLITAPFVPDENRKKGKRKHTDSESEEHKKQADEQTDIKKKKNKLTTDTVEPKIKKRKKKCDSETEYINLYEENTTSRNKKSEVEAKFSEESDAIETDMYEEEILTPHEQGLLDMSDCTTIKDFKKRLVAITKSVDARRRRISVVKEKIANIEAKGLNAKNKKYHTAMHNEKLTLDERIKKLEDAKEEVLNKLKELGYERNVNYKEEQKKRKLEKKLAKKVKIEETKSSKEDAKDELRDIKADGVDLKQKMKEIKVLDSVEPALDVPSVKDFFFGDADAVNPTTAPEESSSSDEETTEQPKKKRKKQTVADKLAKLRAEEERIRCAEEAAASEDTPRSIEQFQRALLATPAASQLWIAYMAFHLQVTLSEDTPRSIEQFQRALLATPAASQLWIAYMAFHLQATEVEKARAVARRALEAIPFREERDRLNVWLALLSLEHRFGTKESQQKTVEEALQMNDPYKVHSALLDILVDTGKHHELSSLVDLMLKKYKRQREAYVTAGAACYKLGLLDKARHVMQRALAVLDRREHVPLLVQFALLERSRGERERAEALLEQVLAAYPQRVDVCATYVDMLLKDKDVDQIRQVLERMTSLKLPARKMKILFKKWIEVEEKLGDEAQVENIRQRAMEFIEKAKF